MDAKDIMTIKYNDNLKKFNDLFENEKLLRRIMYYVNYYFRYATYDDSARVIRTYYDRYIDMSKCIDEIKYMVSLSKDEFKGYLCGKYHLLSYSHMNQTMKIYEKLKQPLDRFDIEIFQHFKKDIMYRYDHYFDQNIELLYDYEVTSEYMMFIDIYIYYVMSGKIELDNQTQKYIYDYFNRSKIIIKYNLNV